MRTKVRYTVHGAVLAALYVVLTHMQNMLLPGSTTAAVQCRLPEALNIFALFTPAAVPGLTMGCILFNMTSGAALPLDFLLGAAASFLSSWTVYATRRVRLAGYPVLAPVLPALWNGLLVGWELTVYAGGGFWANGAYVALGEFVAMMTLGNVLLAMMKTRHLEKRLFG